jgi:hypothetical protein
VPKQGVGTMPLRRAKTSAAALTRLENTDGSE